MFEKFEEKEEIKAVLVGVCGDFDEMQDVEDSLDELSFLLETAGGEEFSRVIQNRSTPDPKTYIGSGKVREVAEICKANSIKLAVFDIELSPSQIRNLEDELSLDGNEVKVIDRTILILDIFALHAKTAEGKIQVELAQLRYTIPRLTGKGTELSRLGGGIGTRGPGESKLESDRRHLKKRIASLEEELEKLDRVYATKRKQRDKSNVIRFAIAGYTNTGKSTLLNYLTSANILAENKLFATLDPTTRSYKLPSGREILLTDTVGFIRNLPHHLIKAFKSTLDEVLYCDALLLVVDASDKNASLQIDVTRKLLDELGAGDKEVIYVFNKCDLPIAHIPPSREMNEENTVFISAKTGEGLDLLIDRMERLIQKSKIRTVFAFPNSEQGKASIIYSKADVIGTEYGENQVKITAYADEELRGRLERYIE